MGMEQHRTPKGMTITIDRALGLKVKARAALEGRSVKSVSEEALRLWLGKKKEARR